MLLLLVSFAASFVATLCIVSAAPQRASAATDHDTSGPQKFHRRPVPRIGGFAILIGLWVGAASLFVRGAEPAAELSKLLLCSVPAFAAGLVEDLTKTLSVRTRLVMTALSALLAAWAIDATIVRTGIGGLDWLASHAAGAMALAVFVVTGMANATNLIDGFNGLASLCAVMMLASLSYVAYQLGDPHVLTMALVGMGAILGFFPFNFPAGLVFLGDGGAYLLGFIISVLAILLLKQNAEVSPMFPLLLCIYPVFETLFSIYRKRYLRGMSPSLPDGVHLHMLVYKRLMRSSDGKFGPSTRRNSLTSPYMWALCLLAVIPASIWWYSTPVLSVCIVLFAVVYVTLYWRIVRFRSPRWLIFRS